MTTIKRLTDTDPAVSHYSREGSFGYLHHELRTPAADKQLERAARKAGYSDAELAGLLISKMGRWAGDMLSFADADAQLEKFLADRKTRAFARGSYRAEIDELATEAAR